MFNVLYWVFVKRFLYHFKIPGFSSSLISYSDSHTTYEGFNSIAFGSVVKKSAIGKYSYIAGARVQSAQIGRFCSIGPKSRLGGLGHHPVKWISTHPVFFSKLEQANVTFSKEDYFQECADVRVGNDVWIGAGVLVLDGVSISDGAIIAAGAVVTKDVEPYAVMGGIPAKLIKYRFDSEIIDELLCITWWNWPDTLLEDYAYLFRAEPTSEILAQLRLIKEEKL